MIDTVVKHGAVGEDSSLRDIFVRAFRTMLLARVLDEKLASLYRMGKIHGGVFLGRGQEALSVALGLQLRSGDIFAPLIRDTAGRLAFGEDLLDPVRTYLGSQLGPMRGRDGNVHRGRPLDGIYAMISHLGAMISVVNGALMARRLKGLTGSVGASCIGDGGTSTGAFHEAVNQAAVEKLPLVLVVANNQYAYSTPNTHQFACDSLVTKALGYGIQGYHIDGTSLSVCMETLRTAISRARGGAGPQMIVADLLRLCGHGEHDDGSYVKPGLKASPLGRDCVKVAEQELVAHGWADQGSLARWRSEAVEKVDLAVAQVQREAGPDPYEEDWCALATRELRDGFSSQGNNEGSATLATQQGA